MKNYFYPLFIEVSLVLIFFASSSSTATAQERESRPTYQFSSESERITNIQGWIYDRDKGKWCSAKNVITTETIEEIGSNNVYSLQMFSFTHNSIDYHVLCVEDLGFYYDYAYIQEGRHSYTEWHYYLLPDDVFLDINNLELKKPKLLYCVDYLKNNISHGYTNDEVIYNFINHINNTPKASSKKKRKNKDRTTEGFMVVCQIDANTLRFNTAQNKKPDVYSIDNYISKAYDNKTNYMQYFEISMSDWNKLFIINVP